MSFVAGACLTSLLASLLLQHTFGVERPQAPRDPSAVTKGTASLRGKVVTADTGRPIRRAQVSLTGSDGGETRTVSTNALGVFEVAELPAGRYTISVSKSGYLRLQHGQRRPGEPGRPRVAGAGLVSPKKHGIPGVACAGLGNAVAGPSRTGRWDAVSRAALMPPVGRRKHPEG